MARRGQALQVGAAILSLLTAAACGNSATTSTNTSLTSPSDTRCQASVTNTASPFGAAGGTGTIAVVVARECQWSAASGAPWVTITSGAAGQGDGSVTYRVAENPDPVARQASLVVVERQVAVAQQAAPCRFDVSLGSAEPLPPEGGDLLVQLRTHSACSWTAASEVAFAAVSPTSGRGNGSVRAAVEPNIGPERRIDLVVAGERVTAMQRARLTPPAPAPTPPAPGPPPAPAPQPPAPPPPAPPPPAPPPTPGPAPPPAPAPPAPAPPAPGPSQPSPGPRIELEGRAQSVAGSCPIMSFGLAGRVVFTTPETRFRRMGCDRLRNGLEVSVEGRLMSDGTVRADEIRREGDNDDDDDDDD